MNKRNMIPFLVMVALCFSVSMALADTHVVWDGAGTVDIDVYSDDDRYSGLHTYGAYISGEFDLDDYENNPYGYGVDTIVAYTKATVNDGFINFTNRRDDSKLSYGAAGQISTSYVGSSGNAYLQFRTTTNYASLTDAQYGFSMTNFGASGSSYVIKHQLTDSDGDGAQVLAYGSGVADIKLQGSTAAGSSFNMGHLPVCGDGLAWDNNYAKYIGSGEGVFELHGWSHNGLSIHDFTTVPGDGSEDSATFDLIVGYSGSWTMPDFGISGN